MPFLVFADESGISNSEKCFAIGALFIEEGRLDKFNDKFAELRKKHGVQHEAKWSEVRKSHGLMNFAIDLLKLIIRTGIIFTCIVVKKDEYNKWKADKETAFYTAYGMLLAERASLLNDECTVHIDDRSDSYKKRDEAMEVICNRMLSKAKSSARIQRVSKSDSKLHSGVQAADLLTGAVNAAHNLYLDPTAKINKGKLVLLKRLAAVLGWDALHYDTYRRGKFNIWHFPPTYKAIPDTKSLDPDLSVPYVKPEEIA